MFLNDDMVECPYNNTHRMLRKRLQSHLLKCRLIYTDVELRKCPFNITHLIPEPEFTHHATNCPDRKLITQYKYDAPEPKEEEGPKHAPIECDENWDDTDVNDYDPRLHLDKANVIRKPNGANRSERKLFIKKERKRLGDGDDSSDDSNAGIPSSNNRQVSESYNEEERVENRSPRSNERETCSRNNRSTSPSTSFNSRERSRSPKNKYNQSRSRSPVGLRRSYEDQPPNRRSNYSSFNSTKEPYYIRAGRNANNNQYNSGREPLYSSANNFGGAGHDRNVEASSIMPEAPPPPMISYPPRPMISYPPRPMISYPPPRSFFATKPPPHNGN